MTRLREVLRRPNAVLLLAILLAALAVRVALARLDRVIRWDEPDYLTLGINLFSGKGYTTGVAPELHYTPLFPIVSGVIYLVVKDPEIASNAVYVIAGTLMILPAYGIARRVYGTATALISACLLSVYPPLSAGVLYWGTMTEPLYILLVISAFYAALVAVEDDRALGFAACGALLSLAYLTRPEASITFAVLLGFYVLVRLVQRRLWNQHTLGRLVVFILAFAMLSAPYLGFLYAKSGRLLVTGKLGLTYAMGQAVLNRDPAAYDRLIASLDDTGNEIVWYSPDRFRYSVLADLRSDPAAFAHRSAANTRILFGQLFARTIFPTFLTIPLLLGLISVGWDGTRLRREAFLATAALPVLAFLPFHVEIRFYSPAFPILLIWVAHGLEEIGAWLAATWSNLRPRAASQQAETARGRLVFLSVPMLAVLAVFLLTIPSVVTSGQRSLDWTHKAAGQWMATNTEDSAVVMSRDLAIALYARRPWVPSPNAQYEQVISYARYHGVDYYVTDRSEITTLRPQLAVLLDEEKQLPELVHVMSFQDDTRRTIIYRIRP